MAHNIFTVKLKTLMPNFRSLPMAVALFGVVNIGVANYKICNDPSIIMKVLY